jgi:hypothetical protein
MSDPQPSRPELPIIPALVVSSLLGGLIALGLSSAWRLAFPGPLNPRPEVAGSGVALPPAAPAEFIEFLPPLTPQEQRIEEALEKLAECEFTDTPLIDLVAYLAERASIKMVIDVEALMEEGISTDTPVTRRLDDVRLRSLLSLILERLQLTAVPRHEVLMVTTRSRANEYAFVRTYPVSDLCRSPVFQGFDFQSLIRLIEEETSGPWMSRDGVGGTITEVPANGSITVNHRYIVHREILQLLRNLRGAQSTNLLAVGKEALKKWDEQRAIAAASRLKPTAAPAAFVEVIGTTEGDAERRIEKALDKSVTINFRKTSLTDIADFFSKELSINVLLDQESLVEEGIASDTHVTLQLQPITARSALEVLLRPLGLDHVIVNEVLLILSTAHESRRLISCTYPVSDLIGPNANFAPLIEMLENSAGGQWIERDGEGGIMTEFPPAGSLVVRQTSNVHRQVLTLLRQQREAQQMAPARSGKSVPSRR